MTKIYKPNKITGSEWRKIARDMLELVACIVGLIALNEALSALARWIV